MRTLSIINILILTLLALSTPTTRAQQSQFADAPSQRAFAAVYAIDNEEFQRSISAINDKAKAAFLKEYMALMNYTASNSSANYDAFFSASDDAFSAAKGSKYEANLLCQLHIHRSAVYMYNGSLLSAGLQFWKSYNQFKSAEKKYPSYDGQLPFRGAYNILLSQIPEKWKTLKGLLGLDDGNLALGFKQIEQYRQKVSGLKGVEDEALVFSFANMFFSHDQNLSDQLTAIIKENPTPVVRYAYILSCGRRQMGQEAENILSKTPNALKDRFPLFYHQMSKYALRRENANEAILYAQKFISFYTGSSNKCDAYLVMAYANLLNGNKQNAIDLANKCMAVKSDFDIDKRTRNEASYLKDLDPRMLRAQLQFEYGNFEKSRNSLLSFSPLKKDIPEYFFRMARAEEKLGNSDAALAYYDQAIAHSQNSTRYFGPYACIYAADIKINEKDYAAAKKYVDQATKLNNGEYEKELDQRIALTTRTINKFLQSN